MLGATLSVEARYEAVSRTLQKENYKNLLDAARLDYISSAGLRVLLIAVKKCGEVKVVNASPEVKEIFATTGFDQMIRVE